MATLLFQGGVHGVTGSCFLLTIGDAQILIDCGMFQGGSMCELPNWDEFEFDATKIKAVFVTHAHYDHCGRLPLLVKRGFQGTIYTTPPTQALVRIILEDAVNIIREESKKCGKDPLYDVAHVKEALDHIQGTNYHTEVAPVPGIKVMFHNAGHILGSSYISVDIDGEYTEDGEPKRIVFSGDLGNENIPILPDLEPISRADIIVSESTYGDRDHTPVSKRTAELEAMVKKVIGRGGTLIIPSFSVERAQELLYELDRLTDEGRIPDVPVYLDSPLAIRATGIYRDFKHYLNFDREILMSADRDFFAFPRLRETLTVDESMAINKDRNPKIIISGSGMMNGGRVQHHLRRYLSDEKNGVLIIGYQAIETLGRTIQEGAKEVEIFGDPVEVKAEIATIDSFSGHADRFTIASWLETAKPLSHVYLVHGDPEVKIKFKAFLEDRLRAKIVIPKPSEQIVI